MKLSDYLIAQEGIDWPQVLQPMHWILPREFTLWLVNRFGDLFIVLDDGSVHHLDMGTGGVTKLADDKDDFGEKIDLDDNANDWLMIPLVDQLVASGMILGPGQCYSYRQLPVLGGDYTVANTVIQDLSFHYATLGPIFEKIKDLPDGSKVKFVVEGLKKGRNFNSGGLFGV